MVVVAAVVGAVALSGAAAVGRAPETDVPNAFLALTFCAAAIICSTPIFLAITKSRILKKEREEKKERRGGRGEEKACTIERAINTGEGGAALELEGEDNGEEEEDDKEAEEEEELIVTYLKKNKGLDARKLGGKRPVSLPAVTGVLHSQSHLPSSSSTSDALFLSQTQPYDPHTNSGSPSSSVEEGCDRNSRGGGGEGEELKRREGEREELSLLALLVTVFRKSLIACTANREELCAMEIGWPTNVQHVAHVTFDRFDGFLGLPVEFEPEVPRRAPSASTSVFGVSTESMQLSYDSRGNCVPTILLLMQRCLYVQGGLKAEGIFRINAENSQEEFVRDQLNRGNVPENIDVHCLAGLIKAWFRELPTGILDPLSPDQVMQCESEEDFSQLVRLLPPTEAALLDWAINLMADVVHEEQFNKMNAHNMATVFAPNMTQMVDPLTALIYTVQVMIFLKTLIMKTLREREDSQVDPAPGSCVEPSDERCDQCSSQPCLEDFLASANQEADNEETEPYSTDDEPDADSYYDSIQYDADESHESPFQLVPFKETPTSSINGFALELHAHSFTGMIGSQSSNSRTRKEPVTTIGQLVPTSSEKIKSLSNLGRISSRIERTEAW